MNNVFISYALADHEIVKRILSELRGESLAGWKDTLDIASGESISDHLRKVLRGASAVVVMLSPKALASKGVLFEVGAAQALGKQIILVIIEGEGIEYSIPESLQDIQWLDARNKPAHEVARRLKDALTGGLA